MDILEIEPKRLDLLKKSNELLERTKKEYKKYEKERKIILEFTRNESVDYDEWQNILTSIENLINSNSDNE